MDLFSQTDPLPRNLLPRDGTATYYGDILGTAEADKAFDTLLTEIAWRNDEYHFAGKHIATARKIAGTGTLLGAPANASSTHGPKSYYT